ncbi:MAG: hypothetical protein ACKVI4_14175 [Actinomycetales bacterium]
MESITYGPWNDPEWEEKMVEVDDGSGGKHGPYHVAHPGGRLFEVHPWHVCRDHNSGYPIHRSEWAHMTETGKHAAFHAMALFGKPGRELMAKTIVVVRLVDGSYGWCVRFEYTNTVLQVPGLPSCCGPIKKSMQVGSSLLWPLPREEADALYEKLYADPAWAQSSLVHTYIPTTGSEMYPSLFPGARPVTSLPWWPMRAMFVALNVVTHDQSYQIARMWRDRTSLRQNHIGRRRRVRLRSPRVASPPLVDTLGQDLVGLIVERVLDDSYLCPHIKALAEVLDMRLVCKAFNVEVRAGMRDSVRIIHGYYRCVMDMPSADMGWLYRAREYFTSRGIGLFSVIEEFKGNESGADESGYERTYLRLMFNKLGIYKEPPAPLAVQGTVVMSRVTGGTLSERRAYYRRRAESSSCAGTRSATYKRVVFKMRVPCSRERGMDNQGWWKRGPQEVPECSECVFSRF